MGKKQDKINKRIQARRNKIVQMLRKESLTKDEIAKRVETSPKNALADINDIKRLNQSVKVVSVRRGLYKIIDKL